MYSCINPFFVAIIKYLKLNTLQNKKIYLTYSSGSPRAWYGLLFDSDKEHIIDDIKTAGTVGKEGSHGKTGSQRAGEISLFLPLFSK